MEQLAIQEIGLCAQGLRPCLACFGFVRGSWRLLACFGFVSLLACFGFVSLLACFGFVSVWPL